jgi:hypothetical protein
MSDKSKLRRKEYDEKQEKHAKNIVNWIFGILVALGIIFLICTTIMQS